MNSYNIRVLLDSSSTLNSLVSRGVLRRVDERLEGVNGTVYTLDSAIPSVLDHFTLRVADRTVSAHLFALPPEEYAGLLRASPEFTQYPVAHLLPALLRPLDSAAKQAWVRQLAEGVRAGARVDTVPRLLGGHTVFPARWVPARTRFCRQDVGWFLSLFFEPPRVPVVHGVQRSAAGIDVGLNTLAVAAYRTGLVHRAAGVREVCVTPELLEQCCPGDAATQREVARHLPLLRHAAARLELHQLVTLLLSTASVVYIEDLQYKECSEGFKRRSRELGLRDFLMTWLPKRLAAQGIPWQRVKPDRTSQYCNLTHLRGERDTRDRTRFKDGNGNEIDADVNAAMNIMQLGFSYRIGRSL